MKILVEEKQNEAYENCIVALLGFDSAENQIFELDTIYWDDMTIKLFDDFVEKWRKITNDEEVEFGLELNINDVHNEINDGLISKIESDGDELSNYPVDESQTISNAGDTVQYMFNGKKYEIITWNECADEHERNQKQFQNLILQNVKMPEFI